MKLEISLQRLEGLAQQQHAGFNDWPLEVPLVLGKAGASDENDDRTPASLENGKYIVVLQPSVSEALQNFKLDVMPTFEEAASAENVDAAASYRLTSLLLIVISPNPWEHRWNCGEGWTEDFAKAVKPLPSMLPVFIRGLPFCNAFLGLDGETYWMTFTPAILDDIRLGKILVKPQYHVSQTSRDDPMGKRKLCAVDFAKKFEEGLGGPLQFIGSLKL